MYIITGKINKTNKIMSKISTTKMTSKGQVVIPEEIRVQLGLKVGSRFIVLGNNDVIILKIIPSPSMEEFDALIDKAREQALLVGLKKTDISAAISKVREKN